MSEYQFYDFVAIDRPLEKAGLREMRALSTRAEITPTRFTNHYEWGDFKGDPDRLLDRHYDLFLYLANWGTRRFSMRLPGRLIDAAHIRGVAGTSETLAVRKAGAHLIVDFCRDQLEIEDWHVDDRNRLGQLAPLRTDVLNGDFRVFYLVWLMDVQDGLMPQDQREPLPGLGPLNAQLKAFAEFFGLEPDLVEAAAGCGAAPADAEAVLRDAARRLRDLSDEEKTDWLLRLHRGNDPHLGMELRRHIAAGGAVALPEHGQRSAGDLVAMAKDLIRKREKAAVAEREAAERREAERRAEERRKRVALLRRKGLEAAWRDLEGLVALRNPKAYDQAIGLLQDIACLLQEQQRKNELARHLDKIRARHATKRRFIERLDRAFPPEASTLLP